MIFTDYNMPLVLKNTLTFSGIWLCLTWLPMAFAILLALNGYQRYRSKKQGV